MWNWLCNQAIYYSNLKSKLLDNQIIKAFNIQSKGNLVIFNLLFIFNAKNMDLIKSFFLESRLC